MNGDAQVKSWVARAERAHVRDSVQQEQVQAVKGQTKLLALLTQARRR